MLMLSKDHKKSDKDKEENMDNKIEELVKEAVADFCENKFWKGIYDNAPGKAKRYYALTFAVSDAAPFGDEVLDGIEDLVDAEIDELYCTMTDDEWDYVLSNAEGASKMGLGYARKMMQGMPVGTRYGYWRES